MANRDNKELLDTLLVGRVKPHIYAFTTNTIPNYLKIGDTYRPVNVRLREWMSHFPKLKPVLDELAVINDDIFFRDYSIHQYIEQDLGKHRLEENEFPKEYYSNEFFKDVQPSHVLEAINDIKINYAEKTGKYKYYDANNKLPETYTYASTGFWSPRPNQQATIDNFVAAVDSGRTNLLMYAVMRFGKSFTSLCCAKAKGYKLILVVSAKADVREEWKKTVQSADNFNDDYVFITGDDLLQEKNVIKNTLRGGKGVVIFLTLQDLQGECIKNKHQEVFGEQIDLLIVDETHYGARADNYGKVLRTTNYRKDTSERYADDDFIEANIAKEQIKSLSVKVTLHLSGTPYRILMGSEFEKEDIIAFYQFSDIAKDQEEWDKQHLLKDTEDIKEWDNPYYGFPQMVRFAFVPSKSAKTLLDSLKRSGTTYALSALLEPRSIKKDVKHQTHKMFVHEKEVLELFEVIDGSKEDDELLSFLDYEKIKNGKMCQHIVCVLPYCASCDALEKLILDQKSRFKNLQEYMIINISGVDNPNEYKTTQAVKLKIKQYASQGKKTLTLTVNRMLTGSTVEEWDTMIFLKDTASPQEYDQAIFRLQNQYIKEYIDNNGDKIKYNMKPQTLLVDFDPHRMFAMQEQKSQIYNANTDASGNEKLKDRLEDELKISPIIILNKNRIERVEANDILAAVSKYSSELGVLDEAKDIPVDMNLLDFDAIKEEIKRQAELGSRQGLSIEAHKGLNGEDGTDLDGDSPSKDGTGANSSSTTSGDNETDGEQEDIQKQFENKFRTYYSKILFFSFLTKDKVSSLEDIIRCISLGENVRIANNLDLESKILSLIRKHINIFILRRLDYKIQNINTLARDESVDPIHRATVAIKKFGRISESEISTPDNIASDMINLIPDDCFIDLRDGKNSRILDIASKMGEFAIAVLKHCNLIGIPKEAIKNKILSIPTSKIAYEFTRKVYDVLGLNKDAIAEQFVSYDLLGIKSENAEYHLDLERISKLLSQNMIFSSISLNNSCEGMSEVNTVKFNAVVGNPPYQMADGGGDGSSAKPIYNTFVDIAKDVSEKYISMIIPSRWFSGGKGLDEFRATMLQDERLSIIHDFPETADCFPSLNIRGGVCYFLYNKEHTGNATISNHKNSSIDTMNRPLLENGAETFIRYNKAVSILQKVKKLNEETMDARVSSRLPFGIPSNFKDYSLAMDDTHNVILYRSERNKNAPKKVYITEEPITKNLKWKDSIKVLVSKASPGGDEYPHAIISAPILAEKNSVCTETYLIADFVNSEEEGRNLISYMRTRFFRFMMSLIKNTQNISKGVFAFVPVQNWEESWSDEKLYQKYGISNDEILFIESLIRPMP